MRSQFCLLLLTPVVPVAPPNAPGRSPQSSSLWLDVFRRSGMAWMITAQQPSWPRLPSTKPTSKEIVDVPIWAKRSLKIRRARGNHRRIKRPNLTSAPANSRVSLKTRVIYFCRCQSQPPSDRSSCQPGFLPLGHFYLFDHSICSPLIRRSVRA